jgi:hypothetical protein
MFASSISRRCWIETYEFERFECVCVFSVNDGCSFLWHINLSEYCVLYLPSVEMERGFTSKSGAGGAGVVFLWIGLDWIGLDRNLSECRVSNL